MSYDFVFHFSVCTSVANRLIIVKLCFLSWWKIGGRSLLLFRATYIWTNTLCLCSFANPVIFNNQTSRKTCLIKIWALHEVLYAGVGCLTHVVSRESLYLAQAAVVLSVFTFVSTTRSSAVNTSARGSLQ